ncbi:rhodanese-like domain-containing protein [Planctomicrobium sp. SH664]|uniref:rhodanese-like domain-containing protein n=1 Tax=Planctomicrobium sp. SH664 TaxID=3448125 RepID=UPI003F5C1C57
MTAAADLPLEISCEDVHSLLNQQETFTFLDCREQNEHDTARISGAKLLPMSEIQNRLSELEGSRQQRIVVHCHHGGRSLRVARWLRSQNFPQAQSMAGGIDEWSQKIDSTVPRY